MRSRSTANGLFSPDSNSLRTTVISLSRSCFDTCELIMRSASSSSDQASASLEAGKVWK